MNIFGDIKKTTIQRNARRSQNWLLNKIKKIDNKKNKPIIGKMYLFVYDAKTKDKLPFWDVNPLVIPIDFKSNGFLGINFHYLPISERKKLLSAIVPFSLLTDNSNFSKVQISYNKLLQLSNSGWKWTLKRYLYSQMKTKFIEIPKEEWINTIELPIAHFKGASMSTVHRNRKK